MNSRMQRKDLDDAFVRISVNGKPGVVNMAENSEMYDAWLENSSGERSAPEIFGADTLKKLYPKHSLVMSADYGLNLLGFPEAYSVPRPTEDLITNLLFVSLRRQGSGGKPNGFLLDSVDFGGFETVWRDYKFIVYIAKWPVGFSIRTQHFILFEGPEEPARELLLACGIWSQALHDEIWVFDQGNWRKDRGLWEEVQKANWDDVILKKEFKEKLIKDVLGFFNSEDIYKKYALPWKRGIIMWGPPGNGKTISLKAIMKGSQDAGYLPLYVKSFISWRGEEGSMTEVFRHARVMAPCVVILEDLDSLINDRNRSFFLNQLDGLEGNDGLLIIGTTNHIDKLDPGLSSRPSRFDRKFKFDDPDKEERTLYIKYWQNKLIDNEEIEFPDSLVTEIADITYGFSFAFLKEAFVSTLVTKMTENDKADFANLLKGQIKELRKQLDKAPAAFLAKPQGMTVIGPAPLPPKPDELLGSRNVSVAGSVMDRFFVY